MAVKKKNGLIWGVAGLSLLLNLVFAWQSWVNKQVTQEGLEKGNVVRVIDGDTFDLLDGVRVRLAGADASEYPQGCLSLRSKERLEELILGKEVLLEPLEKDSFGRQLAFVRQDELLIDQALIDEGLAQATNGDHPQYGAGLLAAQDAAQKAKRGIWSAACTGEEDCLIKGSYRRDKDTKIYHLPECYNYSRIVVNQKEGDAWFCSEKEAQEAGFRKSQDCPGEK